VAINVQLTLFSAPKVIVFRLGILVAGLKPRKGKVSRGQTIFAIYVIG
jgi:hypothetical protein